MPRSYGPVGSPSRVHHTWAGAARSSTGAPPVRPPWPSEAIADRANVTVWDIHESGVVVPNRGGDVSAGRCHARWPATGT